MNIRKSPTVLVPLESYLFLQDKGRFERCGKHFNEAMIQRLTENFNRHSYKGRKQIMNDDLGGCIGKPEKAWEEGRWTSWSVENVKKILDEVGLPWEEGVETEYIEV